MHQTNLMFNMVVGNICVLSSLLSNVNATARLIIKRREYDHPMDSLRDELHWLCVQYRFSAHYAYSSINVCTVMLHCISLTSVYDFEM